MSRVMRLAQERRLRRGSGGLGALFGRGRVLTAVTMAGLSLVAFVNSRQPESYVEGAQPARSVAGNPADAWRAVARDPAAGALVRARTDQPRTESRPWRPDGTQPRIATGPTGRYD